MPGLLLPVAGYTGSSSWQAHINRGTPSEEPGTDFYVPTGTPVIAPADGEIWGYGNSVAPATGRWVGVNFANGMSFRCMHHRELRRTSGRVFAGDVLALSGSSGYGSEYFGEPFRNANFWNETGGDHTHATLWPTWAHLYGYWATRRPYTIDLMDHIGGFAGGNATPFPEDDMYSDVDRTRDNATAAKIEEIRSILYGAGLGDTAANTAATATKIEEVRQILYNAGFGKLDEILAALSDKTA